MFGAYGLGGGGHGPGFSGYEIGQVPGAVPASHGDRPFASPLPAYPPTPSTAHERGAAERAARMPEPPNVDPSLEPTVVAAANTAPPDPSADDTVPNDNSTDGNDPDTTKELVIQPSPPSEAAGALAVNEAVVSEDPQSPAEGSRKELPEKETNLPERPAELPGDAEPDADTAVEVQHVGTYTVTIKADHPNRRDVDDVLEALPDRNPVESWPMAHNVRYPREHRQHHVDVVGAEGGPTLFARIVELPQNPKNDVNGDLAVGAREVTQAERIRRILGLPEAQTVVQDLGYSDISLVDPIVVIEDGGSTRTTIFPYVAGEVFELGDDDEEPPEGSVQARLDDVARRLNDVFWQNGLYAGDLSRGGLMVVDNPDGRGSLRLIDTEYYTDKRDRDLILSSPAPREPETYETPATPGLVRLKNDHGALLGHIEGDVAELIRVDVYSKQARGGYGTELISNFVRRSIDGGATQLIAHVVNPTVLRIFARLFGEDRLSIVGLRRGDEEPLGSVAEATQYMQLTDAIRNTLRQAGHSPGAIREGVGLTVRLDDLTPDIHVRLGYTAAVPVRFLLAQQLTPRQLRDVYELPVDYTGEDITSRGSFRAGAFLAERGSMTGNPEDFNAARGLFDRATHSPSPPTRSKAWVALAAVDALEDLSVAIPARPEAVMRFRNAILQEMRRYTGLEGMPVSIYKHGSAHDYGVRNGQLAEQAILYVAAHLAATEGAERYFLHPSLWRESDGPSKTEGKNTRHDAYSIYTTAAETGGEGGRTVHKMPVEIKLVSNQTYHPAVLKISVNALVAAAIDKNRYLVSPQDRRNLMLGGAARGVPRAVLAQRRLTHLIRECFKNEAGNNLFVRAVASELKSAIDTHLSIHGDEQA